MSLQCQTNPEFDLDHLYPADAGSSPLRNTNYLPIHPLSSKGQTWTYTNQTFEALCRQKIEYTSFQSVPGNSNWISNREDFISVC